MHSLTSCITLAALLLHFTLGLGGHTACAAPAEVCEHGEHHQHAAEGASESSDAVPDGRACLKIECGVILPSQASLAVPELPATFAMAVTLLSSQGNSLVSLALNRSGAPPVALPLRAHLVYQLLLI